MKIFLTVLLAMLVLNTSADVGYNYPGQQQLAQSFNVLGSQQPLQQQQPQLQQQQQQQQLQQQQPLSLIMLPITQPSQHYLPAPSIQPQLPRYQQPLQHPNIVTMLPMPIGFPNFAAPRPIASPVRRSRPRVKIPKKPIITKNFFIHAAPEESEEDIQDELNQLAQQPRKHYNVLFVKTPSQTSRTAALNLAKTLKEEKTVVYVLSKKTSAADLQDAIAEAPQHINKPEVFFIKYRTPEEAINAQRQIQTQYDSLGGTSTITDEGVAPITSVVGSLDAPEEEESEEEQQQQQQQQQQPQQQLPEQGAQQFSEQLSNSINNVGNQYLPPNRF